MLNVSYQSMRLKDGRSLSYAEYGDLSGAPVIGFHGTPGARVTMKAFEKAAAAAGVHIIAPERPGYGYSQPNAGGTLTGYADEVLELATALGLERFGVIGVSGGGPYALACAYKLAGRLSITAVVSGIGPLATPGSMAGMAFSNRMVFSLARFSPALVGWLLPKMIRPSFPSMERSIHEGTSPSPLLNPELFAIMATDQYEAIRAGGKGVALDMSNLWRPWGFSPEDIRARVLLWHGDADDLAPIALARQFAKRLPNCETTFYTGEGHTGPLLNHSAEIMQAVVQAGVGL